MARDRDDLPSLPDLPWEVAREASQDLAPGQQRNVWTRTNRLISALRSLAIGVVSDIPSRPQSKTGASSSKQWFNSTTKQREMVLSFLNHWTEWLPAIEAVPTAAVAYQRLFGSRPTSYNGVSIPEAQESELDSKGRVRLPKGAMTTVDVDEVSFPPPGTKTIPAIDISEEVRHYFHHMTTRMLVDETALDLDRIGQQRVYEDPSLRNLKTRMRLAERMWISGILGFTNLVKETLCLFGVVKKYEDTGARVLRPVWDERRANLRWLPPPFVPLGSPTSFAHLDLSDLDSGDSFH